MNEPAPYRHTQTATLLLLGAGALLVIFTAVLVSTGGNTLIFAGTLLAAVALLMNHSIAVSVDFNEVEVRVGNGWLRRSVRLTEVANARIVEVGANGGLIARRSQRGWVFAARAGSAVQVETRAGDVLVIGSDESQVLLAAIERLRAFALDSMDSENPAAEQQ